MRLSATIEFEKEKNKKALAYTLATVGLMLFLLFIISWQIPPIYPPLKDEGIEVNLGNGETGWGDIAPMIPGDPAPEAGDQQAASPMSSPPAPSMASTHLENNSPDAVAIPKTVAKTTSNPRPVTNQTVATTRPSERPPAPPRPRATMSGSYSGGTGTGGNSQDSYNNVRNQGIAGGTGDQGSPNGNINSDNYNGSGGTGRSGVSISRGLTGRAITRFPSFEDDFNENAKIAVDLRVDANGRVTSASYQSRGSTSSSSQLKTIALRKARELKFNPGEGESIGTVVFNFRLTN